MINMEFRAAALAVAFAVAYAGHGSEAFAQARRDVQPNVMHLAAPQPVSRYVSYDGEKYEIIGGKVIGEDCAIAIYNERTGHIVDNGFVLAANKRGAVKGLHDDFILSLLKRSENAIVEICGHRGRITLRGMLPEENKEDTK